MLQSRKGADPQALKTLQAGFWNHVSVRLFGKLNIKTPSDLEKLCLNAYLSIK